MLRWSEKYTKTDMVYLTQTSFWINANTIIVTGLSFGLSLLLSRFVSKEVYGTYQFLISVSSILGALTLTGMNAAVGQAVSRGCEGVFNQSVKTQLKFGAIPLVIGLIISVYYLTQNNLVLSIIILLLGIIVPLSNALNTWGAYLTGKKSFKAIFFYSQISNFLYYGTIIIPIFFFPQVTPLILFYIGFGLVANLIVYFDVNRKYPPNNLADEGAISYGKKLSFSNILPMAVYHIDNIIVFHLLGAKDLAIYSFASNIPDRFMSLLRPIPTIAFPKFSEKSSDEVAKILPQKIIKFFVVSVIGGIIYFLLAPFIYNVIFPEYKESLFYSQVYIAVSVLSIVVSLSTTALFATRSSKIFVSNVINPIFGIITMILGGYMFGIWGVIFARILSNVFNLIANTFLVVRHDSP